jgi:hypothetical protein
MLGTLYDQVLKNSIKVSETKKKITKDDFRRLYLDSVKDVV